MLEDILQFLETYTEEAGTAGFLLVVVGGIWAWVKRPFAKKPKIDLSENTIKQLAPREVKDAPALTVTEFIRIRRELKAELEQELSRADDTEKSQLRARIAELESQIANPNEALEAANKRIKDLEALLDRSANEIGGDRIAEAKAALEKGDYSIADDIFAEIEAKNQLAVEETARAAFGRGEVAEAEVRWADAAKHYAQSARYNATFEALDKAGELAWLAGDFGHAQHYFEELVRWAEDHGSESQRMTSKNDLGVILEARGAFVRAEAIYRDVLSLDQQLDRSDPNDRSATLTNLANVLTAQARFPEAEEAFTEAIEISRNNRGANETQLAAQLSNLSTAVQKQGRHSEAEEIIRDAMDLTRNSLGEEHPTYAVRLNNLGLILLSQDKLADAEQTAKQALAIDERSIGVDHPEYAKHLSNLATIQTKLGKLNEAESAFRQAIKVTRRVLGEEHPSYAIRLGNLASNLAAQGKEEEARVLLDQALSIFRATLPEDHPHIVEALRRIEALPPE